MGEIQKPAETAPPLGVIYDIAAARRRLAPRAPSRGDAAQIGGEARELSRASAIVEASPEIRADRVSLLQTEIEHGTYRPDPREVARQILARGL